jgi:L-ribulose-5-phosphate 3-epimerase
MKRLKIGVRLESLGLSFRKALAEASRLGVAGVRLDAVGDFSPQQLSQTGRRELRHLLRGHDLELTALGCPLRHGLDTADNQQPRLEHVKGVMSLSRELGPGKVIVEAGAVPNEEEADTPRAHTLRESLLVLALHGDRIGTFLALETGLESGQRLAAYLGSFDTGSLGVNYDPANLLLHGFDPYEGLRELREYLRHMHARDARRAGASRAAQEVPLGHGDIDWLRYADTLVEVEYSGWVVIERQGGERRLADIEEGVGFLRRFLP